MKKSILTIFAGLFAVVGFAQFTIGATSLTFTGHAVPAGSSQGQFYSYQPNGGGTFYTDNACSNAGTQGDGASFDLGGFDPNIYDATTATAPYTASDGIIFFGGGIRRIYSGASCDAGDPSFGFHTGTSSGGIGAGSDIDLSSTANQKISFTYQSNVAFTLELQLFSYDGSNYISKLTGSSFTLTGDNAPHTVTLDFSSDLQVGVDMTNIREVAFTYTSETKSASFGISLADIKLGSAVTGLLKSSASLIRESNVYPNPASGMVTFSVEMEKAQDLKILISNLMGQEVEVIVQGTYASLEKSVDVSSYQKGIYSVNYFINGAPAKAELLIVK